MVGSREDGDLEMDDFDDDPDDDDDLGHGSGRASPVSIKPSSSP